ncbi:MAG: SapC family protein [Gammaproteobacteria bacterium]|nr:peptide ABC transporter permease [Gammaproteobacteria bacterium]
MTRTVALDNIAHKDLRVRTGFSAEFGDNVNMVLVFPTEFVHVQREYPILFRRSEEGHLQAFALLGFDKYENLFLTDNGWNGRYVPAVLQRGPFLIGFRKTEIDGELVNEPVIHVDLDHPRISTTEGEPIFLRHGGHSPYLERANRMLQLIYKGTDVARTMYAAFEEAGLLEEKDIEVHLDDRVQYKLTGFQIISPDTLAKLDATMLEKLHKQGYLQPAILVASSLGNINWLIELKNRKRAAAVLPG